MRKGAVLVSMLTAVLVFAACGGDDDDDDDASATTTTAASSDTTAASSDTTAASSDTTSVAAEDPLLEVIRGLAGGYSGTWTNSTFGSTGSADMTITLDEEAGVVTAELDLGGNVFGEADPGPETFEIALDVNNLGNPFTVTSATFGEVTSQLADDGTITIDAPDVPGDRIATFSATAQFTATGWDGTYTVAFEESGGGGSADGTFSLAKS
jgi:hypothetical protein